MAGVVVAMAAAATPAAAGGEAITAPTIVRTGAVASFAFTAGDETGAYTANLMQGSTLIARVGSGSQIDDLGSSSATFTWVVPTTKKLGGTGYSLAITAGATTLVSGTFEIAASTITNVAVSDNTVGALSPVTVSWSSDGGTGGKVGLNLLHSDGKTRVPVAKSTANDGSEAISIPGAKVDAGQWKIEVVPELKTATAATSSAFTVATADGPTIRMLGDEPFYMPGLGDEQAGEPTTFDLGGYSYVEMVGLGSSVAPTFALYDSGGKKIVDLGNGRGDHPGRRVSFDDAKLAKAGPGAYELRASVPGSKTAIVQPLTLRSYKAPTLTIDVSGGVTAGQSVAIQLAYTKTVQNGGGGSNTYPDERSATVSIVATDGTTVAKVASKQTFVDGSLRLGWIVSDKLTPGSQWKLQILNDFLPAGSNVMAETSTFIVRANTTTPAKKITGESPAGGTPTQGITAPTTVYTGDTTAFTFTAGTETGAYTVDLMQGTTLIARIASGTQIDALGEANETATIPWTIPTTMKLDGSGYSLAMKVGAATITSGTFSIAPSKITAVFQGYDSVPRLHRIGIEWASLGVTGDLVAIDLVNSAGKAVSMTKSAPNDGQHEVTVPYGAADGSYTVRVTPLLKTAVAGASGALTVAGAAPHGISMNPVVGNAGAHTAPFGGVFQLWASGGDGDKFTLTLNDKTTGKVIMTFAKGVTFFYEWIHFVDPKLAANGPGTYEIRATSSKYKGLVTTYDVAINGQLSVEFTQPTKESLARGVTHGQPVTLAWQTGLVDGSLTVQVTDGTKATVLSKKELLNRGSGGYRWIVSDKLKPGTTYRIQLLDNTRTAPDNLIVESLPFTIAANPTTLAKDLPK